MRLEKSGLFTCFKTSAHKYKMSSRQGKTENETNESFLELSGKAIILQLIKHVKIQFILFKKIYCDVKLFFLRYQYLFLKCLISISSIHLSKDLLSSLFKFLICSVKIYQSKISLNQMNRKKFLVRLTLRELLYNIASIKCNPIFKVVSILFSEFISCQ